MTGWLSAGAATWLDATLAATLISGGTALAMIQCRQPARRRVWGRSGLAACLAVWPLVWLNPLPRLDLSRPPTLWVVPHWDPHPRSEPLAVGTDQQPGGSARSLLDLVLPGLILAHAGGSAVALGRLGLGLLGARLLIARSEPAAAATEALLAQLPFDRGPAHRPTVRVSPRLTRPVLLGVVRSVIVIPPALDEPAEAESLRLGLLHELAHAEIDDQRLALLADLTHALWFFLPTVGWIRHQFRLDGEFLADHRAVGSFGTTHGYAASLVGLARRLPSDHAGGIRPASASRAIRPEPTGDRADSPPGSRREPLALPLVQRVQMLLGCPFKVEDQAPRLWSRLVGAVTATAALLLSTVSVQPAHLRGEVSSDPALSEPSRRGLDLAELAIAAQAPADGPIDLRFRLPPQFLLRCEILANPQELRNLEILGYRLGLTVDTTMGPISAASWHQVELTRTATEGDRLRVDGQALAAQPTSGRLATSLTIRPGLTQVVRLRNLHLGW